MPRTSFTEFEWDALSRRYPPGTVVQGTVIHRAPFGVFVRLDELPDIPALLEMFQLSDQHDLRSPVDIEEYPAIGSQLTAWILVWNRRPHDLRLTQRAQSWYTPT